MDFWHRPLAGVGCDCAERNRGRRTSARGDDHVRRVPQELPARCRRAHRRARYPSFARLAAGSTWYPNATTKLDETGRALEIDLHGPGVLAVGQAQLRHLPEQPLHAARSPVRHRGERDDLELLPQAAMPERPPPERQVNRARAGSRAGRIASRAGSIVSARGGARRSTTSTCCCRIRPGCTCRRGASTTTVRARRGCPGSSGTRIRGSSCRTISATCSSSVHGSPAWACARPAARRRDLQPRADRRHGRPRREPGPARPDSPVRPAHHRRRRAESRCS